jgi:N-acetylglucosamine kinase-like BadF-type ATPase
VTVQAGPGRTLFLGVDGGGTKTEFMCIDADGAVVAQALTSTTYHVQVGLTETLRVLAEGIGTVCAQLSITPGALRHAFFGLPAYGEDPAIDLKLHAACGQMLGHGRYDCGNDMICGWAGSLACQDGINLVAGTGSIGYGEHQGRSARVGGWGEVFGDEGSAYWIAIRGLNAFSRMSDGRLPISPLYPLLRQVLSVGEDLDLCARVMGENAMSRGDIAGLARVVALAAQQGDSVAAGILDRAASDLADHAIALRKRLGFARGERARLSWSGGVLTGEAGVLPRLVSLIDATDDFIRTEPCHPPGYGAALYARNLAQKPSTIGGL